MINGKIQAEVQKHSSSINGITETVPVNVRTNFKHKKVCKICSKGFTRLTNLREHSAKFHPNEPPIPLVRTPTFNRNRMTYSNGKNIIAELFGNRPKKVVTSTVQQTDCIKNQLPVGTDGDIDQDVKPWWLPKKTSSPSPMTVAADPRTLETLSPVMMPLSDVVETESKLMIDEQKNTNNKQI